MIIIKALYILHTMENTYKERLGYIKKALKKKTNIDTDGVDLASVKIIDLVHGCKQVMIEYSASDNKRVMEVCLIPPTGEGLKEALELRLYLAEKVAADLKLQIEELSN